MADNGAINAPAGVDGLAAVGGVQHDSLPRGGQALSVIQPQGFTALENREAMMRMVRPRPAAASRSVNVVVTMMVTGSPLC
jgi:hypothetical protein